MFGVRYNLDMTSWYYFIGGGVGEKLRPSRKNPPRHPGGVFT